MIGFKGSKKNHLWIKIGAGTKKCVTCDIVKVNSSNNGIRFTAFYNQSGKEIPNPGCVL